jgi:hypothetical protein
MIQQTYTQKRAVLALLGLAIMVISACGGVSQSEYDAVREQLTSQAQQANTLQEELSNRVQALSNLEQQFEAQASDVAGLQQEITALEEQLGEAAGASILIAARFAPEPTPRPTPTPLPPGAELPPRPVPPDFYEGAVDFAFYVETLTAGGVSRYGVLLTPGCVPNSIFKRGALLVWRFEIFDISAGKRITETDEAEVKVVLPHGEELTGRFSQRGGGRVPDAPWMWAAAWHIPPDYPLGALNYSISVTTEDGRTATFMPPALVSETSDSRVQIVD